MTKIKQHLTYKGKTLTLRQWSEETKIPLNILKNRIYEKSWDVRRALTEPPNMVFAKRCLSRSDCARELDETPWDKLHPKIQKFFKTTTYKKTDYGRELYDRSRVIFNWYYEEVFDKTVKPENVEVCV